MKKMIAILAALLLTLSFALADTIHETKAVTISLNANATTGFAWSGFVMGGDSVVLSSAEGTYVVDDAPEGLCGVGGQTYFTLIPVKPGASIVVFSYVRGWEPDAVEQRVVLADVDEELNLYVSDVTEGGRIEGTVISVDEEAHSVLLNTESHGEIIATFDADMALPVADEHIVIYTNGTMTMSLPAIMNVIAWNTVAGQEARRTEPSFYTSEPAVEGGVLIGAYYHCSGDENGNVFSAGIDWTEDGTLALTVEEKDDYSAPLTVNRYAADEDSLIRIAAIVNEYNMVPWSEREDVIFVCDAAYPQLCLVIAKADGDVVNVAISSYIELTDEEMAAWRAVKNIILEGRSGELIETYQIEAE